MYLACVPWNDNRWPEDLQFASVFILGESRRVCQDETRQRCQGWQADQETTPARQERPEEKEGALAFRSRLHQHRRG